MRVYKERRDLFCMLLSRDLGDFFKFETPKGGMAVWVTLHKKYSWAVVTKIANKYQLEIGDYTRYDVAKMNHNSIRIGFAFYNNEEIYTLIDKLSKTMKAVTGLKKSS